MRHGSDSSIQKVLVFIFFLILAAVPAGETHAQPQVDESIIPYLSGAAHRALFGPDPQLVREREAQRIPPETAPPAIGTNIQANDPSSESCGITGCTQSETSIAVDPSNSNNIAAGWNDGVGFFDPAVFDISGFGYSIDGGVTWTDGGTPPNSSATIRISGDPSMAVCGDGSVHFANLYVDTVGTFSGLAVSNGSFTGGALVFDPAGPVVAVGNTVDFYDKEYLVCDPATNILYMSYTNFIGGSGNGQIELIRSTDGGATWNSPVILQAEENLVNQGSYPAVGPGGQVCVAWERDWRGEDPHIVVKCSTDYGQTFTAPWVRAGDIGSVSSDNPPNGYNRTRINDFPSIAIDTSGGPNNGNIYVAWHSTCEAVIGPFSGTDFPESEPNDTSATADSMFIGDNYSGTIVPETDADFVSFYAVEGQTIRAETVVGGWFDSTLTLYDTDGLTILDYDDDSGWIFASILEHTMPSTGTFFLAVESWWESDTGSYALELRDFSSCGPVDPAGREPLIRDIIFSRSTDGGATFSPEQIINDDPAGADQWWPWISVNQKGQVGIIWYDRRNDPYVNDLTDVYFALSNDGGVTFEPNVRVTDASTSWTGVGSDGVSPNFGDYINLSAGCSGFHALWADGRLGDPDVFYAAVGIVPEAPTGLGAVSVSVSDIDLSWSDNSLCEDGFRIERKMGYAGAYSEIATVGMNETAYRDTGLTALKEYYYRVTAYNSAGNSDYSNQSSAIAGIPSTGGGTGSGIGTDSGGGGCFIATAAYGSYMADEVMVLREFRDRYLLTNSFGRTFVKAYYKYSPPVADVIRDSAALRAVTRAILTPVVISVVYPYQSLGVLIVLLSGLIAFRIKIKRAYS